MITWGSLINLWWLGPVLMVGLALIVLNLKFKLRVVQALYGGMRSVTFSRKLWWRSGLMLFGVLLCSLAILGPRWGKCSVAASGNGRDLLIALDVSKSMLAQDLEPNRLEFAKSKIRRLLQLLPQDRVGLILFSGEAFVFCPLTSDLEVVQTFLADVSVETVSSGTTDLAQPIELALKLLADAGGGRRQLLAIFTDGEDFSQRLAAVSQRAKTSGLAVFALGIGTEQGSPVPKINLEGQLDGYIKDREGRTVLSKLNNRALQELADQSGGIYQPVNLVDDTDLNALQTFLLQFEKGQFKVDDQSRWNEKYYYLAGLALLSLGLEWLI